jgi:hypothetical protein
MGMKGNSVKKRFYRSLGSLNKSAEPDKGNKKQNIECSWDF